MKNVGMFLIILQIIAIISRIVQKGSFFNGGILELIGYFSFGIIGIILIITSKRKNK